MSSDNLARKIYLSGRFYVWVGHGNSTPLTKQNKQTISDSSETPISKFCNLPATILFPIRKSNPRSKLPTVRKRCDSKYFLGDLRRLFFLVTGNRYRKFQYYSRIYVRNWFTLLNEQNLLLGFEGTRFVNEHNLFKKKKKSPYLPTHRWNGGSGVGNEHISKGGLNWEIKVKILPKIILKNAKKCAG